MIDAGFIKELNERKNQLDTNFKAESIAVELIKRGVDPQKIFIVPNGVIGKRAVKDVELVRIGRSMHTMSEYVYIVSNRAGIYDTLPEGLFHEDYGHSQSDAKSNFKTIRKQEQKARQFFAPFEILLGKYNATIAYGEDLGVYGNLNSIIDQFSNNWTIFKSIDERQSALFLHVIPILTQIRANYKLLSNFLSLFFDVTINVTLKQKIMTQMVQPDFSLSESKFGLDSVLGGMSSEFIPIIDIQIGPLADEELALFVPQSKNDKILDELASWLFDCQMPIEKEIIAVRNDTLQRPATYYLGTNTFF